MKLYEKATTQKYKVVLVQLPLPSNKKHKKIIPLGLTYVASSLLKKMPDVYVEILDAQVNNMPFDKILDEILKKGPDVLGISYWTVQSSLAKKISIGLRSRNQNIIIVHGGVHPTTCPEEALDSADYCVLHEGEQTFPELVSCLMRGESVKKVRGLAYKENGEISFTEPRPLIENLDDLPFPAFNLLNLEKYNSPLHIVGGSRLPIIGSRGCPYKCSFCASPLLWKGAVRFRSPENVVEEMKFDMENYGINQFHFWDDNLMMNSVYIRGVCELIIQQNLDVKWVGLDRAEHINKNKGTLPLIKKAGCVGIEIGVESANPCTFSYIKKNQKLRVINEAIENLKKNGIFPLYTYMAFNPGETIVGYYLQKEFLDGIQEGLDWYKYFHPLPFPVYIGQFATPYPGTRFYEEAEKLGMILAEKPEYRYHQQINFVPNSLLDDYPLRTKNALNEHDYILFLILYKTGLWEEYSGDAGLSDNLERLGFAKLFLEKFYEKCDGDLSLREIANLLAGELGIPFKRSVRLSAYIAYIFGQVGILRSGRYNKELTISPRWIEMPENMECEMKNYLKIIEKVSVKSALSLPYKINLLSFLFIDSARQNGLKFTFNRLCVYFKHFLKV